MAVAADSSPVYPLHSEAASLSEVEGTTTHGIRLTNFMHDELCVRYSVNGRHYWDNNNSMNYHVEFATTRKDLATSRS
jgi:hypothetical protein